MTSTDAQDPMVTNFITRAEYESRHAELQTQITRFDVKLDTLVQKLDTYNAALNTKIDQNRSDFNRQMIETKQHAANVQLGRWRFFALQVINFMVGGATYALGEWLIVHIFH